MIRHDLVSGRVNQEGRCSVGAASQLRDGRDGGYELGRGRGRPGFIVGGSNAIQQEREAIPFFEEREDKLGTRVTRAHPA